MTLFRNCFRPLRRRPGIWLVSAAMLAMGLGATLAVFSILDRLLFVPLPVKEPQHVVEVSQVTGDGDQDLSYGAFSFQREHNEAFERMACWLGDEFTFRVGGEPAGLVGGAHVSSDFLATLGLRPLLGREFTLADEVESSSGVMLSEALWRRAFHGDPSILGHLVWINGQARTVVGIGPRGFSGFSPDQKLDAWLPLPLKQSGAQGNAVTLARLRQGQTVAQAQVRSRLLGDAHLATLKGEDRQFQGPVNLRLFQRDSESVLEGHLPKAGLLLGACACLLLLACANVANLLLAEGLRRQREFASRMALGATPGLLFRQVMSEGLALVLPAGALGLLLARPILNGLLRVQSASYYAHPLEVPLDGRILVFALALTIVSILLALAIPAWQASRVDLLRQIKDGSGTTRRHGLQEALAGLQVALSLVLVAGSFGAARGLRKAMNVDYGFQSRNVACLRLSLAAHMSSDGAKREQVIQQLRARFHDVPGILDVGIGATPPLEPGITIMLATSKPDGTFEKHRGTIINGGYFKALSVPFLAGQDFQEPAPENGEVIVNEALAAKLWPQGWSEGKQSGAWNCRGVVKDFAFFPGKGKHEPIAFLSLKRFAAPFLTLLVRTQGPAKAMLPALRVIPPSLDRDLVVVRADTLDEHLVDQHKPLRLALWLFNGCGAASLVLAAVGLFALLNHRVTQARRELGLRMILGATQGELLRHVLAKGLLWSGLGIGAGLAIVWGLDRLLRGWTEGLVITEPITLLSTAAVMIAVTVTACLLPALRALRIQPVEAMRND